MTTETETKPPSGSSLAAALAAAGAEFRMVGKSGENKFHNYKYARLDDYIESVRPVLHKHGLSVHATVDELIPLDDRETRGGKREHVVRVRMTGTLLHTSGESLSVVAYGEGQDDADKCIYKAITGCRKYLLASLLNLATSDDPEADETTGVDAAPNDKATKGVKAKLGSAAPSHTDIKAALYKRGWSAADVAAHIPIAIMAKFNCDKFADLSPERKVALLDAINAGKLDAMRIPQPPAEMPPAPQAAPAPASEADALRLKIRSILVNLDKPTFEKALKRLRLDNSAQLDLLDAAQLADCYAIAQKEFEHAKP